jgi:Uma2 family endonuclease
MVTPRPDTADRLLTAAEFAELPEEGPYRLELVRGRVVRSPRPGALHGRLVLRLGRLLDEFVEAGGHGVVVVESGALLERDPDTVRGPDVAFYSRERIPENAYAMTFWGPPDLAVEITSPGNRVSEIQEKVKAYLDAGVRMVWVIDPHSRTATVYRAGGEARLLGAEDSLDGGAVLPGFRLPLISLFAI